MSLPRLKSQYISQYWQEVRTSLEQNFYCALHNKKHRQSLLNNCPVQSRTNFYCALHNEKVSESYLITQQPISQLYEIALLVKQRELQKALYDQDLRASVLDIVDRAKKSTTIPEFALAIDGGPLWQPLCYAQIEGLALAAVIELILVRVFYAFFVLDLKIIKWETSK